MNAPESITLIGFGEVGQHLAKDFAAGGVQAIHAWDIAFASAQSAQSKAAKAQGVIAAKSCADSLRGAKIVISAVTAGSDEDAARTAVQSIEPGAFFVDVNSVSPGTKIKVGKIIEAKNARFVEVAVMSPISPRGIKSPMLLGGPHARDFIGTMRAFDPDMTAVSDVIGRAAATKMCRSVMYKGLEALFIESMISARHYGVEEEVLASLGDTFDKGWPETARYMISRALIHGKRRAEEMREAAKTVEEAGLAPLVTREVAEREEWAGAQLSHLVGIIPEQAPLDDLLDALLRYAEDAASK